MLKYLCNPNIFSNFAAICYLNIWRNSFENRITYPYRIDSQIYVIFAASASIHVSYLRLAYESKIQCF